MAPTAIHTLLSRDNDPSLRELFHHFPAALWRFFKLSLFGLSLILAFFAVLFGVIFVFFWIYIYGAEFVKGLTSVRMSKIAEGPRERIFGWRRIWVWLNGGKARGKAEAADAEELRRLDSQDGEGREGSVGGETLLNDEDVEDGDENEQASKKDEIELVARAI